MSTLSRYHEYCVLSNQRHLFSEFASSTTGKVVYINAASRSPLPSAVLRVGVEAMKRKADTPWDIGDTESDKQHAKQLFAAILGDG